jgi:hypothetical protein
MTGGDPRAAACAHWQAAARALSGTGRIVVSWDGGRSYPLRAGRDRPLPDSPPDQPATVFVYDPGTATGRTTVCDFDIKKAEAAGAADPAAAVAADAAAFAALVAGAGGRCLQDISPGGGRHVYVLWERAQPWLELKQLARALARRYPSLDTSPHNKLTGLIRPPGARYRLAGGRSPGWQLLTTPLAEVPAVISRRCGPQVWNALHAEFAAELEAVTACSPPPAEGPHPGGAQLDSKGDVWLPRGRRLPLREDLEQIARTGRYPARYPSGSEARMAVLCSAAARGWQLHQVSTAMRDGTWAGLASFYARYSASSRAGALSRDWKKAVAKARPEKTAPLSHTRHHPSHPQGGSRLDRRKAGLAGKSAQELVWAWRTAIWLAERDPGRKQNWGGAAVSIRMTLRALAAAMQMTGSTQAEFGCRDLALHAKISSRAVAAALRVLREEPDPLVRLTRRARGLAADRYQIRIPAAYQDDVLWHRWRTGIIEPVHPAFRVLGPAVALVWEMLGAEVCPVAEIARMAVLGTSATRRALVLLGEYGLSARDSGGWRRGPAGLDEAAAASGADLADASVRQAYEDQRRQWRQRLSTGPEPAEDRACGPSRPAEVPVPRPRPQLRAAPPRAPPAGPDPDPEPAALLLLQRVLGAQVLAG